MEEIKKLFANVGNMIPVSCPAGTECENIHRHRVPDGTRGLWRHLHSANIMCIAAHRLSKNLISPSFVLNKTTSVAENDLSNNPNLITSLYNKNKGIREWADDTNLATKGAFINKGLDDNIHFAYNASAGWNVKGCTHCGRNLSRRDSTLLTVCFSLRTGKQDSYSCLSRNKIRLNNPYFPKAPLVAGMSVPYFPTLIPLFFNNSIKPTTL